MLNSQYKNITPPFLFHIPYMAPLNQFCGTNIFKQKIGILFKKCFMFAPIFL
jgi:hypothetical protein